LLDEPPLTEETLQSDFSILQTEMLLDAGRGKSCGIQIQETRSNEESAPSISSGRKEEEDGQTDN
jgi:hypothetical protein